MTKRQPRNRRMRHRRDTRRDAEAAQIPPLVPAAGSPLGEPLTMAGVPSQPARAFSPSDFPPCACRQDFNPEESIYFCAHPLVHIANQLVTPAICAQCTRWQEPTPRNLRPFPTKLNIRRDGPCMYLGPSTDLRDCPSCRGNVKVKIFACDHPDHLETTYQQCATCFDYEPRLQRGSISEWSVGVTTAPRSIPTLMRCLESLLLAGWQTGRIFAEPGAEIPVIRGQFAVTWRESRIGAWPNWYLGLAELYMRQPFADAYLLIQDDAVCCRNLRPMLERTLWPAEKVGVVSPYCPRVYARSRGGFREVEANGNLVSAVTLILPNAAARSLLAHAQTVEHRLRGSPAGQRGIDSVVGRWAASRRFPIFFHTPSLVDHIGDSTTIWSRDVNGPTRTACDFVGEEFDALSFPP